LNASLLFEKHIAGMKKMQGQRSLRQQAHYRNDVKMYISTEHS